MTPRLAVLVLIFGAACKRDVVCPREGGASSPPALGDANGDGQVDLSDGCYVDHTALGGGPPPSCDGAADVIANGQLEVADSFALWSHLFAGADLEGALDTTTCSTPWSPTAGDACGRLAWDFDAPRRLDGATEVTLTLKSRDIDPGPEGWSVAVEAEGCVLTGATTEGTDAAHLSQGGRRDTGYDRTELVEGGAVSAVVLDWATRDALEPRREPWSVLTLTVAPQGCEQCSLRMVPSLQGPGQPVESLVSIAGFRYEPALAEVSLRCP